MQLFLEAIDREVDDLHKNKVRLRFIGDAQPLGQAAVRAWRRRGADRRQSRPEAAGGGELRRPMGHPAGGPASRRASGERCAAADAIDEARFARELELGDVPDPDLFIRTGGDHRISNFLLWNLAYTEIHVCEALWPDFDVPDLDAALGGVRGPERRFGRTRAAGAGGCAQCLSSASSPPSCWRRCCSA